MEKYTIDIIECGKGWEKPCQKVIDFVNGWNNDHTKESEQITILQIKEKFGMLTIYARPHFPELMDVINEAVDEAHGLCEVCGSQEHLGWTKRGWITRMCKKCAEERPQISWAEDKKV